MIKHHKIYWSLAILAVVFHIITIVLTYYAIEFQNSYECNSIMAYSFGSFGYVYSGVVSTLLIGIVFGISFVIIEFGFKNNKYKDMVLIFFGLMIVITMSIDMLNDIFSVLHSDLWNYTNLILNTQFKIAGIKSYC